MKKLLMIMLLGIFFVSFASAAEFDNVKHYDPITRTATVNNCNLWIGFCLNEGEEIVKAMLESPLNVKVGAGEDKLVGWYNYITTEEDVVGTFGDIYLEDLKNGNMMSRGKQYKVRLYHEESVDEYETICTPFINGTNTTQVCEQVEIGSHMETVAEWIPITNPNIDLKPNTLYSIGVFVDVEIGDHGDWEPTFAGKKFPEWSEWTADLNTDLNGYYNFNGNFLDSLGTYNGTNVGSTNASGILGSARSFSGSSQQVYANGGADDTTESIALWMKTGTSSDGRIAMIHNNAPAGTGIGWGIGTRAGSCSGGFGVSLILEGVAWGSTCSAAVVDDNWHLLVATRNGNDYNLYVDGSSSSVSTISSGSGTFSTYTQIGGLDTSSTDFWYNGEVDEVGIWKRVLSSAEITQLWNGGTGITYTDVFTNPPTITLNSPSSENFTTPQNLTINFTASDDINLTSVKLYVNDVLNQTNASGINNSVYLFDLNLMDGNYTIYGRATNNNSEETNSSSIQINIDTTPFIEFVTPPTIVDNGNTTDTIVPIEINTTTTILENITYSFRNINGTNLTQFYENETYNITFNVSQGNYNYDVEICTTTDKCNITETRNVIVHTTPLLVNVTAPSGIISNFTIGQNETLIYNISEAGENETHFEECWYIYPILENSSCYQESANVSDQSGNDGVCNLQYDGVYGAGSSPLSIDGDWNTGLIGGEVFVNYTKPQGATNATWFYSLELGFNWTDAIPNDCFSYDEDLLILKIDFISGGPLDNSHNFSCFNGTWKTIQEYDSGEVMLVVYEEAINWGVNDKIDLNCSANTTEFLYIEGFNTISVFAEDEFGLISSDSSNWSYDITEVSQTFNNETIEGLTENFQATVITSESISTATLVYDGVEYTGTLNQTSPLNYIVDVNLAIPSVTADTNRTFYWNIMLSGGTEANLTSQNQTVLDISIDNCSAGTILIMNYSLFEEESQAVLNGTIEVDLSIFSSDGTEISSFSSDYVNQTNAEVCISNVSTGNLDYLVTAVVGYTAPGFAEEFHNIQNGVIDNTTIPINISLFDLAATDSTTFVMSYKGLDFLPLVGSLFNIQRKYISEGVFKSVEIVESDDEGFAKAHFDTEGVIYRITITQDGAVVDSFDNVKVACDNVITEDCQINLNSFSSATDFTTWKQFGGVTFNMEFNSTTRINTVSFNTVDGTPVNMTIVATTMDGSAEQLCSSSLFSSAGVITCEVPLIFGNGTIISTLSTNDINILSRTDVISSNPIESFGVDAFVFAFIMVISFPLIMVGSPMGVMFGLIFGVLASFMLLLADNGGLLGPTAAFTWLLVAAAILIYKMMRRER